MRELFERWVRDHHAAVYRSAWGIVRDADDASEITQEVFLQVLRRPDEVARADHPERLLRWLAVKSALARLRGERNRRRREEETAMRRPEPFEEESPERRELASAVRAGLDALPEDLRLATLLRFREELTFAQVGDCLGVAEATAFERVKRALEKLRTRLAQLGHAGALAQLEPSLATTESVVVPAALAPKLLALSAQAVIVTAATSTTLVAVAAGVVLVVGGILGARALREPAAAPLHESASAATATLAGDERGSTSDPPAPTRVDESRQVPAPAGAPGATRSAADFLDSDFPFPPGSVEAERKVATGSLSGVLVDDDGRAVAGAKLDAISFEGASKSFQWSGKGVTGAAGDFTLELAVVVDGGQHYTLAANHDDFIPHRTAPFVVEAGKTTELGRVAIRRNGADRAGDFELAIVVQDAAGRPIEGAFARIHRAMEGEPWEAGGPTDATGTARVRGTRIGKKQLVIDATRLGYRILREPIEVGWTGFQERRVTLEEGLVLAGRLLFPAGCDVAKETLGEDVPVAEADPDLGMIAQQLIGGGTVHRGGAQVYAIGADANEWMHAALAADGSFRIIGLDPGHYTLHVRSHFSPAALFDVEAGRDDLAIALKRNDDVNDSGVHLAEIHGRLVDAESGAQVVAPWDVIDVEVVDREIDDAALRDDVLPALASPRMVQTAMEMGFRPPPPSADFHATGLGAGRYVVVARVAGFAPAFSKPIELARSTLASDVVVALRRPARVTGIVVDAEGRPLRGAIVFATGVGPRSRALVATMDESVRESGGDRGVFLGNTARSDEQGRFELGGLPPDVAVAVAAVHPRFAAASSAAIELAPGVARDAGSLKLAPRE